MGGTEPGLQAGSTLSPLFIKIFLGYVSMRILRDRHRSVAAYRGASMVGLAMMIGMGACTVTRIPAPGSAPAPESPRPQPAASVPPSTAASAAAVHVRGGGPWRFAPAAGTYTYTLVTEAQIAPAPDTTQLRSVPATTQRVIVNVTPTGDVQLVDPPAPTSGVCDAAAVLATRAQALVPRIPAALTVGATWNDSTTTDGCRGPIPSTTHTLRTFTVVGDTTYAGVPALQVHRADVIDAHGQGAEGQHSVTLSATGTGSAELFFDTTSGRFLGSDGTQTTAVDVGASGRTTRFIQHVHEHATLEHTT